MMRLPPRNRMFVLLIALVLSIGVHASPNRTSPLGINTNEAMALDSSVPFVDLFRLAMPFEEARPWLTKGKIEYDDNGWPRNLNGGDAGTRFVHNFPAKSIPNAVYTVLYDGHGKIEYGANAKLLQRFPGKDLIRIRGNDKGRINATLRITESNPGNYVRNIRVLMPGGICKHDPFRRVNRKSDCGGKPFLSFAGHSRSIVFNPDYLDFMKDFRVIRFMNMSGITRNDLSKWEDRPKLSDATWGGKEGTRGVPLEIMVQLANQLDADPWFNLPHRADDEFVRQYASYVKNHLNNKLRAYIEYTNEAWNGVFSQTHYIMDRGQQLKLDANRTYAGFKYYSRRSVEIFKIWEQVFGGESRLVRVMAGMVTNVPLTHMLLGYEEAYKHTDAFAIAPYFHATQEKQKSIKSVDEVFSLLESPANKYSVPNTLRNVKFQNRTAARYGVDLIAYEGGQHLVAYKTHSVDSGSNPYLIKANKDDRMAKLYYDFLKGWKDAGGKLFVAFSAPRDYNWIGSWGIKEYITQNPHIAPKYRALMYFHKTDRCWWYNCATVGPIARMSKPPYNPGRSVMERRFKPVEVASTDTAMEKGATVTPDVNADNYFILD